MFMTRDYGGDQDSFHLNVHLLQRKRDSIIFLLRIDKYIQFVYLSSMKTTLNIDAGASSIDIQVPRASGCDVRLSTVLSGKSLNGFEKVEHGHYQTENFTEAEHKIYIKMDAAVSSTSIIRY